MEKFIDTHDFETKVYLNGFPKSGLHALALLVHPLVRPLPVVGNWKYPWAGGFIDNSWTLEKDRPERTMFKIGRLTAGHFLKGHLGYTPELERFLYYFGVSHIFIYRDLRDVVVSQAYHVTSADDHHLEHPDKKLYRSMDSFEDVLKAVITGVDRFPGVVARWEAYAPWLEFEWVSRLRFEDLITHTEPVARALMDYIMNRGVLLWGSATLADSDAVDIIAGTMVEAMHQTEASPTFRKGKAGGWREHFTDEMVDLFKEHDPTHWLHRLGYVDEQDWTMEDRDDGRLGEIASGLDGFGRALRETGRDDPTRTEDETEVRRNDHGKTDGRSRMEERPQGKEGEETLLATVAGD